MNLSEFLGRLHPLIVHLPIGFLLIAIVLEWFFRKKMTEGKHKVILFILLLGAVGSVFAALFGWLLAEEGGFNNDILFWHRWLGVATVVITVLALWSKYKSQNKIYKLSLISLFVLLMLTGHYGGSLTHGSDYLMQPFKKGESAKDSKQINKPNDSINIYSDIIQPIFNTKCTACHNNDKQNGGLNLVSFQQLTLGGDNGKIIHSNVWESEIFKRVILPQDSEKFMPPNGNPLTYSETTLLKWWIESGAKAENSITNTELNEEVKNILLNEYALDLTLKPFVESLQLQPLNDEVINTLNDKGWNVKLVSPNSNLMEAYPLNGVAFSSDMLTSLLEIKEHITWLKLGNTNVTDEDLQVISEFSNLTDLRLYNSKITDTGVAYLSKLSNLEALNVYGTRVSDSSISSIKQFANLKRIYLWKTNITASGVSNLQQNNSALTIISE